MAQGPFLLNLAWEFQYSRTVFILTRMEIEANHEAQLAVEGEEILLCLTHLNPGWVEFVIFIRNLRVSEFGLQGTQKLRFLIMRQKLWGALGERTPPLFLF